jgi:hypothetical protein
MLYSRQKLCLLLSVRARATAGEQSAELGRIINQAGGRPEQHEQ